jgi:hypothetical protein
MPLVIGVAAVAFIFLTFLTLITLYWILTKWQDFAKQIPVVGGALANVAQYLRDRNLEIINAVLGVAHAVVSWSIDSIEQGLRLYNNLFNGAFLAQIGQTTLNVTGLSNLFTNSLQPAVAALKIAQDLLATTVNGFVKLNIDAFNFWKAATITSLDTYILPNIATLIVVTDTMLKVTLPGMGKQLDDLTVQALGWINTTGHQLRVDLSNLQITTEAVINDPVKGIIPRVTGIEGTLGQIIPWVTTIGLSIPIARTLARVGRNPCTCLEDEGGQTDMLPLLLYLFEEAG